MEIIFITNSIQQLPFITSPTTGNNVPLKWFATTSSDIHCRISTKRNMLDNFAQFSRKLYFTDIILILCILLNSECYVNTGIWRITAQHYNDSSVYIVQYDDSNERFMKKRALKHRFANCNKYRIMLNLSCDIISIKYKL